MLPRAQTACSATLPCGDDNNLINGTIAFELTTALV